jgi:IclR family acetate operon transcriptional repressor
MAAPSSSVVKALAVCAALAEEQPCGVRELARTMDEPRSSVQRALDSLEAAGWAARTSGLWSLTLAPALVGLKAGSAASLRSLARPAMERLLEATNESVRLWLRDRRRVVLVESFDGRQAVRYVSPPLGESLPLHASASGKAILAHCDCDAFDAYVAQPLEVLTQRTLTEPAALKADLEITRARGFSVTLREARDDVGGVAAALLGSDGQPFAALSLALPMHRLTDEIVAEYGARVAAEAAELSRLLAGSVAGSAAG